MEPSVDPQSFRKLPICQKSFVHHGSQEDGHQIIVPEPWDFNAYFQPCILSLAQVTGSAILALLVKAINVIVVLRLLHLGFHTHNSLGAICETDTR
jgi:hypothetical protein